MLKLLPKDTRALLRAALGEIESDSGVSTIGGHITDCLGHMPTLNESIRIRDYIITVTGTLKNYKGTIEFDAGCQLVSVN